jgi:hypothetical protein
LLAFVKKAHNNRKRQKKARVEGKHSRKPKRESKKSKASADWSCAEQINELLIDRRRLLRDRERNERGLRPPEQWESLAQKEERDKELAKNAKKLLKLGVAAEDDDYRMITVLPTPLSELSDEE